MALIKFYSTTAVGGGGGMDIDMGGSGLGFFGAAGFGASVAVAAWQDNTYVTDGNGAVNSGETNNVKWTHANSGELNSTPIDLNKIPNHMTPLGIRFTNGSTVQVQNAQLRIYDRTSIDSDASGVTTRVYEVIHTGVSDTVVDAKGTNAWETINGTTLMNLQPSPGVSGITNDGASGSTTPSLQHDWYIALSARPDSIGSKTEYGMYVSLEYL